MGHLARMQTLPYMYIVIIVNLFFVNNYDTIQPTGCYIFIVIKLSIYNSVHVSILNMSGT